MAFEKFIAKRYLVSKHKINFISIISLISVIGITLGVAALIVVLSVFNGFGGLVTGFLMKFDPHLRVEFVGDNIEETRKEFEKILPGIENIQSSGSFVSGKVLSYREGLTQIISFKGIEQNEAGTVYGIEKSVIFGEADFNSNGLPNAVIGITLADRMQTLVGDSITIISPVGIESAITQMGLPRQQTFIISGIFNSQNNQYDESFMFTSLEEAQYLLGFDKEIQGYEFRLDDVDESFEIQKELKSSLSSEDYSISTWYDFHRDLYSVMQIERWTAYIILSLIIAVASFNILGSLSMSVIEKKRDIGILRAMGMKENSVLKVFMYEGLMIGIVGTIAGLIIGYVLCWLQINYNIYPLDPTQYKINSLPVELRFSDFFVVSGMSMLLSLLSAYIPAKRAGKIDPLQAIKWE